MLGFESRGNLEPFRRQLSSNEKISKAGEAFLKGNMSIHLPSRNIEKCDLLYVPTQIKQSNKDDNKDGKQASTILNKN